jgi:seryl-tRNA synthetase
MRAPPQLVSTVPFESQGKMEKEQRDELIAKGSRLKEQVQALDVKLSALENALQFEGQRLPNLTHPAVPFGNEDENAVELKVIGSQPQFDFEVRGLDSVLPVTACVALSICQGVMIVPTLQTLPSGRPTSGTQSPYAEQT